NAIHAMLERHPANITVRVEGVAASIASLIAMAGNTIIMPSNALLMLHDPSGVVEGGARDIRSMAELLDRTKAGMVATYARRSRQPAEVVAEMMARETWLDASEAVALGFADRVDEPMKLAAQRDLTHFGYHRNRDGWVPDS